MPLFAKDMRTDCSLVLQAVACNRLAAHNRSSAARPEPQIAAWYLQRLVQSPPAARRATMLAG
jgi:hypothetical protein